MRLSARTRPSPAASDCARATVLATDLAEAEVYATCLVILGTADGPAWLAEREPMAGWIVVDRDGRVRTDTRVDALLRARSPPTRDRRRHRATSRRCGGTSSTYSPSSRTTCSATLPVTSPSKSTRPQRKASGAANLRPATTPRSTYLSAADRAVAVPIPLRTRHVCAPPPAIERAAVSSRVGGAADGAHPRR